MVLNETMHDLMSMVTGKIDYLRTVAVLKWASCIENTPKSVFKFYYLFYVFGRGGGVVLDPTN